MTRDPLTLAVDVGGTKTLLGLVDANGVVLVEHQVSTRDGAQPADDLDRIVGAVTDFASQVTRWSDVVAAGIGFPEYVSPDGLLLSHEVIGWAEQPGIVLPRVLDEAGLGALPVLVGSDVRLGAMGEAWAGAGCGLGSFLYISLGTGLSSTFVIDSEPWAGANGSAIAFGEWPAPRMDEEPQVGNLEQYASGAGIARRYRTLTGEDLTTRQLCERGDPLAVSILTSAGTALGDAIAALVGVLDPDAVIIGGGLGCSSGVLHHQLRGAYVRSGGRAPIRTAALGHRSALVGAAALAWSRVNGDRSASSR